MHEDRKIMYINVSAFFQLTLSSFMLIIHTAHRELGSVLPQTYQHFIISVIWLMDAIIYVAWYDMFALNFNQILLDSENIK